MVYQAIHRRGGQQLQYLTILATEYCTMVYYVVPGNSRTGGAATTIPHNSGVYCGVLWSTSMMYYVVLRCNMERYCYVLCCTMVNCGVLWSTTMMYYGVLSSCTTLYEVIPRRGWGQPLHSLSTWCSLVSASICIDYIFLLKPYFSKSDIFRYIKNCCTSGHTDIVVLKLKSRSECCCFYNFSLDVFCLV